MDTGKIRKEFLIENIFVRDEISLVYSLYDRYIVGGVMPVKKALPLEPFEELKAAHFLDRREMGIINVGGNAEISASGVLYMLGFKEALYLGKDTTDVLFRSADSKNPAKLVYKFSPGPSRFSFKKSYTC